MTTEKQDDGVLSWDSPVNEPGDYVPPGDMIEKAAKAAGAIATDDETQEAKRRKPSFRAITMSELMAGDYTVRFLCKGVLAEGQPAIFGGPQKAFKTSIALNLAVCLATGKQFLGHFDIPKPAKVCYFSGEGGLGVIQDTLRRIGVALNVDISNIGNLIVTDTIPRLDNSCHLEAVKRYVIEHEPVVAFFDPLYLAMSGADTSNVFSMGERLRALNDICLPLRCTPVLLHHLTKRRANPFEPAGLEDLSMAGFAEYAGQWALLSRRSAYDPDDPTHRLWVTFGGRTGHGSQWGLDVHEGTISDPVGRVWRPELRKQSDVRAEVHGDKARKQSEKVEQEEAKFQSQCNDVLAWMMGKPDGVTKQNVKDSRRCPVSKVGMVLIRLEEDESIEPCTVEVPTGTKPRKVSGFRAIVSEDEKGRLILNSDNPNG